MVAYMMKLFLSKFGDLYCKQYRPRSESSPIRAHSVCLHDEIMLEKILKCTADIISRQHCFVKYFCM